MSVKWLEIAAGGGADLAAYDGDDGKGGERVSPSADGSAVMEGFPATPLNLVTIWGAARTGKSFFLNALARVDGLFHVSGAMEPCTSGADLSTVLRSVHDLAKYDCATTTASGASSSRSSSLGAPPLVGFVDVEGQGDRHSSYDVLLATPLLLLSKMVIFNWKGRPNKSSMLDQLAIMTNAASEIGRSHRKDVFGHLVVLLRDVPDREREARDLLFGDEDPTTAATDEEEGNIVARNETRKKLRDAFQSVQVWCLPSPHAAIDAGDGVRLTELAPAFLQKMAVFRGLVVKLLAEPHTFGGEVVMGGFVLSKVMSRVCEKVNERGKDIVPCSLMESVQRRGVEVAGSKARDDFKTRIAAIECGIGINSKAETEMFIDLAIADIMTTFNSDTQGLGKIADKARTEVENGIQELSQACLLRQEKEVTQLQWAVAQLVNSANVEVEKQLPAIENKMPMRGHGELAHAWRQACTTVYQSLDATISETVSNNLREDLWRSIPNQEKFMDDLEAKFKRLIELNKMYISAEDGRVESAERDRMISSMKDDNRRQLEGAALEREQMQTQHEAQLAMLKEQVDKLQTKADTRGCVIS